MSYLPCSLLTSTLISAATHLRALIGTPHLRIATRPLRSEHHLPEMWQFSSLSESVLRPSPDIRGSDHDRTAAVKNVDLNPCNFCCRLMQQLLQEMTTYKHGNPLPIDQAIPIWLYNNLNVQCTMCNVLNWSISYPYLPVQVVVSYTIICRGELVKIWYSHYCGNLLPLLPSKPYKFLIFL